MIYRNRKLLNAVRELPCQLRLPGCAGSPTCACHSNQLIDGKGRGIKASDARIAAGCHVCHRWLDEGPAPREEKRRIFDGAAFRTLALLIEQGTLTIRGKT